MSSLRVLVMGVAGSGKSTLAVSLARELGVPAIEADDHHSAVSRHKMHRGIALQDADRMPWLDTLATMLASSGRGAVLACSALRRDYRDRLRRAVPELRTVFMDIDPQSAYARVTARSNHLFPPSLVRSQFEALEPPIGEREVLRIDAQLSSAQQLDAVLRWLDRLAVAAG